MKNTSFVYNPSFYIVLFLALNILAAIFYVSPNFKITGDATSYNESIKFLEGRPLGGSLPLHRLLTTPLLLVSATSIDFFIHNPYASLAVVNLIFYILVAFVFYKFAFEIYKDKKTALLGTILLISNYHILNVDNFFIADMAGRFFFILANLLVVKYFLSNDKRYYYLIILVSVAGVLFKEFGALGMITLVFAILCLQYDWKEKIKLILKSSALFAVIPILFNLFFYYKFHFTYLDWYIYSANFHPVGAYGLSVFIKVMGWVFLAGWPMFLWGLYQEKKFFDKPRAKILGILVPASLSFFAWPMFTYRTSFVLLPLLCLVSGFGLAKIKNKYVVALLIVFYLVVNYNLERLLVLINLPF